MSRTSLLPAATARRLAAEVLRGGGGKHAADADRADDGVGVVGVQEVCGLWAGMGSIYEVTACGGESFMVKRVRCGADVTSRSDLRKRDSYHVEAAFYGSGGVARELLAAGCVVPTPLRVEIDPHSNDVTICMSKLEGGGGGGGLGPTRSKAVLSWLARLHALFWGAARADNAVARGLQPQGSYWHLDTRPDEHAAMPRRGWEGRLRLAARSIDRRLKASPFQTVVHGDLKDANIMFATDGTPQIYDFQYAGKGACGRDLAYFLTCGSDCATSMPEIVGLLEHYRKELTRLLTTAAAEGAAGSSGPPPPTADQLMDLVLLSIADLGRWMSGWGWWGHDRRELITSGVLDVLDGGNVLRTEAEYSARMAAAFPVP